jgi:hypothetical protein
MKLIPTVLAGVLVVGLVSPVNADFILGNGNDDSATASALAELLAVNQTQSSPSATPQVNASLDWSPPYGIPLPTVLDWIRWLEYKPDWYDSDYDVDANGNIDVWDERAFIYDYCHTNYGDHDLDGKINFADFQVILDHWQGTPYGWFNGDFTGDSLVNFADFQKLLNGWNPVGAGGSPVPEPGSLASLALGGLARLRRKKQEVA